MSILHKYYIALLHTVYLSESHRPIQRRLHVGKALTLISQQTQLPQIPNCLTAQVDQTQVNRTQVNRTQVNRTQVNLSQ